MNKVSIIYDGDGHIYVVPSTKRQEIKRDLSNENLLEAGDFAEKWSWYMVDSIDDIALFADVE